MMGRISPKVVQPLTWRRAIIKRSIVQLRKVNVCCPAGAALFVALLSNQRLIAQTRRLAVNKGKHEHNRIDV